MIINWNPDPILLSIGPVDMKWYGLLFALAFVAGLAIIKNIFKAENVPQEHADHLFVYALAGTIIGARLVHCLIYDPQQYLANPMAILRIWEGGLASHGGAIGFLLGLWLAAKKTQPKLPYLWLLDRVTIPAALGAVLIRLANFINSEIIGNPTSGSWGVIFEKVDAIPRHPAQLYEALAYLFIFFVLIAIYRHYGKNTPNGLLFGVFMTMVFASRISVEFVKTPQAVYEVGQLFSVGQYLSLPFILVGIAAVIWAVKKQTSFNN